MFETVQFVTVEQKAGGNTNVSVGKQRTISPEFQNKATPKNYSSRSRRNLLVKNPRMRTRYSALSMHGGLLKSITVNSKNLWSLWERNAMNFDTFGA